MHTQSQSTLSKKIIFSCFLASCLEIYDFVIFAFLVGVLNKNYLSFLSTHTASFVSLVFFSVGFVCRPLGSLIFGYIGDVKGRKTSLVTSVSLMGIASFTMFILPPYSSIGIASCFIIVLVRILQGISVGGEFSGAIIFAVEHNNSKNAAFVASIISAGGACGILLANLVSKVLQNPNLPENSWRFAFLIGFTLSIIGYFIRKRLTDTPLFVKQKTHKLPLLEGLKNFKIECLGAMWAAAANGTVVYFGTIYLVKIVQTSHPDINFSFVPILVASTIALFLPLFGIIADKINRNIFLMISSLTMGIYCLYSINFVTNTQNTTAIISAIFVYGIAAAMMISTINIFAVEIFPVSFRMSCSSLFYSLGMGLIGGTVPLVSSYIVESFGDSSFYISAYVASTCFLCLLGTLLVHLKHKS